MCFTNIEECYVVSCVGKPVYGDGLCTAFTKECDLGSEPHGCDITVTRIVDRLPDGELRPRVKVEIDEVNSARVISDINNISLDITLINKEHACGYHERSPPNDD